MRINMSCHTQKDLGTTLDHRGIRATYKCPSTDMRMRMRNETDSNLLKKSFYTHNFFLNIISIFSFFWKRWWCSHFWNVSVILAFLLFFLMRIHIQEMRWDELRKMNTSKTLRNICFVMTKISTFSMIRHHMEWLEKQTISKHAKYSFNC